MPIISVRDNENNRRKRNAKKKQKKTKQQQQQQQKKTRGDRTCSKRVKAKWFCCTFKFSLINM